MKKTSVIMDNLDKQIHLVYKFSSKKAYNFFCSTGNREYILVNFGSEPSKSSMI